MPKTNKKAATSLSYKERQERSPEEAENEERYWDAKENFQTLKADLTATEKAWSTAVKKLEALKNGRSLSPEKISEADFEAGNLKRGVSFAKSLLDQMFPNGEPQKKDYGL